MGTSGHAPSSFGVTSSAALLSASVYEPMGILSSDRAYQYPSVENVEQVQEVEVFQGLKGKHEMSRQQWEDMKPLIQRIYIDENKPFPYLAHILRTEHGFIPT
jgi:hypothetical protein